MKGHSEKDAKLVVLEKLYGGENKAVKNGIWIQRLARDRWLQSEEQFQDTINSIRVTKGR